MVQGPAKDHRRQAEVYLANAYELLRAGEVGKAREMLWGSMAQALKALAMARGLHLRQHREVRAWARQLATELKDQTLWDAYTSAEFLHVNFYELDLSAEDVVATGERVKQGVKRVLELSERVSGG